MNTGRDKLDWAESLWQRIDQAVHEEAVRTEVASKFLPVRGPFPEALTVPADVIDTESMTVEEGVTTPLIELWADFSLTPQQISNEESLSTALTLATRAANLLSRAEDLLIFQGDAATESELFKPVRFRSGPVGSGLLKAAPNTIDVRGHVLFVFIVLGLARRRVLHINVSAHPTAAWTSQQVVEALPWAPTERYVMRDRDGIYGAAFRERVGGLGLEEVVIAARSPWQNGYSERFIGSLRQECLDHVIALDERHLLRIVRSYVAYYNRTRTHLSLGKDPPESRPVQAADAGRVVAIPEVGGLHHRYERRTAA